MIILNPELWIGLVELSGPAQNAILNGSTGAYSTYIAYCDGAEGFRHSAEQAARALGMELEEVQWAEPFKERLLRFELENYLYEIAHEVSVTRAGAYGRFHTWIEDPS